MEMEYLLSGSISDYKKREEVIFSFLGNKTIISKLSDSIDDFGEKEGLRVRTSLAIAYYFIILEINKCSNTPNKRTAIYKKYIKPLLQDRELETIKRIIITLNAKIREYNDKLATVIIEDLISNLESVLKYPDMQLIE